MASFFFSSLRVRVSCECATGGRSFAGERATHEEEATARGARATAAAAPAARTLLREGERLDLPQFGRDQGQPQG